MALCPTDSGWGTDPSTGGGGTRGYVFTATSADGVRWDKNPVPVIAPGSAWDQVKCSEPALLELDDGSFRLFYEACDGTQVEPPETGVWKNDSFGVIWYKNDQFAKTASGQT